MPNFLVVNHKRFHEGLSAMGLTLDRNSMGKVHDIDSGSDIGFLSREGVLELYPGNEKADALVRQPYLSMLIDSYSPEVM